MRWLIVLVTLACRDHDTPKAADPPDRPSPVAHHVDLTHPALPQQADGGIATTDELFAAEPVDYDWKSRTEPEIRKRLGSHPPSELECRQTQCRLTFIGDAVALEHTIDDLSPLTGFAQHVTLTAMQPRSNGTFALHAYAQFDHVVE